MAGRKQLTEITEVTAGGLAQAAAVNTIATIGTADVPMSVPAGGPWQYIKVIVETDGRYIAVAVNEVASFGTAGTPPAPVYGTGDVIFGTGVEEQALTPAISDSDVLHFIASAAGTAIRYVLKKER